MCGIVGLINHHRDVASNLLQELEHRGRDSKEIVEKDGTILGHNRLAINDLSEKGKQPFVWNGLHLVVNGEIWNYPQLRLEYEERGYQFFSHSDSEIILYLYQEEELYRLDGMFSWILHDTNKGKLFVSRDWIGKLPLFISTTHQVVIASEFPAIKKVLPNLKPIIVPTNSLIEIDTKTLSIDIIENYYFVPDLKQIEPEDSIEVKTKTLDLITNATGKRLISDVPIATCLSGGIDSSVITYLLSKSIPNLKAYTIKFDEQSEDLRNARIVAEHLGIELVEVEVPKDKKVILERTREVLRTITYPLNVQVQVGVLQSFIAEQMKRDGIKVAFSGEGADESFGSYGNKRLYSKKEDWSEIRQHLHRNQHYGNLLRGNTTFMKWGTIELRMPFFDKSFINYITNLPDEYLAYKTQWKLPLANAFKGKLPDEILDQEKRAFQKGTNFKNWFENVVKEDKELNPNSIDDVSIIFRKWFIREYGYSHKKMMDDLPKNMNIYKFFG